MDEEEIKVALKTEGKWSIEKNGLYSTSLFTAYCLMIYIDRSKKNNQIDKMSIL